MVSPSLPVLCFCQVGSVAVGGEKIKEAAEMIIDEKLVDALIDYAGICEPGSNTTLSDVRNSGKTGCELCEANDICKMVAEEGIR